MHRVLLINQEKVPHYRVPVYNYLSKYLKEANYHLAVISGGIQDANPHPIQFRFEEFSLSFLRIMKFMLKFRPDVVIFWVNLKCLYLFPILILTKVMRKKAIYWGHGRDLLDDRARLKNLAYALQHTICDAIILYAEYLKKYVSTRFHYKVFVANNTLNTDGYAPLGLDSRDRILSRYGIETRMNIICMGRMQKRKRLKDLFKAFEIIDNGQYGLILVGPDSDGILREFERNNVYKLGPIYGEEALKLLEAADVCCIPGAVGLSIVDAFYSGLPIVTEEGEISPEIMYLKNGINGFIVPKGNVKELAVKLSLLLTNNDLRAEFSRAAKSEIALNGHIDVMCKGFYDALQFVKE